MRTLLGVGREGVKSCLGSSPEQPDKFFLCCLTLSLPFTAPEAQSGAQSCHSLRIDHAAQAVPSQLGPVQGTGMAGISLLGTF